MVNDIYLSMVDVRVISCDFVWFRQITYLLFHFMNETISVVLHSMEKKSMHFDQLCYLRLFRFG